MTPMNDAYAQLSLAEKTLVYWQLSSIWNGRSERQCSVEQAIRLTNRVSRQLDPHRPVAKRIFHLHQEIVFRDDSKSSAKSNPA